LKELVPLLIVIKSYWRGTNSPHMPTISPNKSNRNFEIAILFSVVKRSRNYVFEVDKSHPATLGERVLSYALAPYKVFIERMAV